MVVALSRAFKIRPSSTNVQWLLLTLLLPIRVPLLSLSSLFNYSSSPPQASLLQSKFKFGRAFVESLCGTYASSLRVSGPLTGPFSIEAIKIKAGPPTDGRCADRVIPSSGHDPEPGAPGLVRPIA